MKRSILIAIAAPLSILLLLCLPTTVTILPVPEPDNKATDNFFSLRGYGQTQEGLPYIEALKPQVDFWKGVFTVLTSKQGIVHDSRYVDIVYDVISFTQEELESKEIKEKIIKDAIKKYTDILTRLDKRPPAHSEEAMDEDEHRVFVLFADVAGEHKFRDAIERVRVQRGQKDLFRRALTRSSAYLREMEKIFTEAGLPVALTRLPFIESSFNVHAYSFVGAAGLWQFIRSTGKEYLRVDGIIDERLDPLKSTRAAARLLAANYKHLKAWPLAVTAYNHGAGGMQKAVDATATRDLGEIIANYKGPNFGFASRNFYAELLAVLMILEDYRLYFAEVEILPPQRYEVFPVEHYVKVDALARHTSLNEETIERLNPELTKTVLASQASIPKGYPLRVPQAMKEKLAVEYAGLPSSYKRAVLTVTRHKVKKGQSLEAIAKVYDVSADAIVHINCLKKSDKIKIGQLLIIPDKS